MEMAKPQAEHGILEKLVGSWEVAAKDMGDAGIWTEQVRSLHGMWFVAEGNGQMPGGGAATTVLTLGCDPDKGKYVGSWIGSMMTHMWVYEGEVSADGNTLSLYTTGPDFEEPGKTGEYREQIIFTDADHRIFNSSAKQPDGSWKQFMEAHYSRVS
ncbi:DUF1579 domain-containing protein [Rhizobium halophilum]|uniref:DUF1579 domain-containing protein n=1 Tax=Rhizobium halophilum TaxID=2846852 RepID=UPI001EFDF60D|nr:DUF1579 domain-containing protein [Rhizobium halophilum]MCF6370366.1 DUF1579 domain-containing protein [Rhizobium halophilum]